MIQFLLKLMGDPHEKKIKAIMPIIEHINALEPEFEKLSDEDKKKLIHIGLPLSSHSRLIKFLCFARTITSFLKI